MQRWTRRGPLLPRQDPKDAFVGLCRIAFDLPWPGKRRDILPTDQHRPDQADEPKRGDGVRKVDELGASEEQAGHQRCLQGSTRVSGRDGAVRLR